MKTLVVYDSRFGNTKLVAEALGEAIPGEVEVVHAGEAKAAELGGYDLLVVGAPTHGGRPSDGAKAFLGQIQGQALAGVRVAGFDTRVPAKWVRIFGYAAPRIAKALAKKGGRLAGPPGDFYVLGTEGPLKDGELERAAAWAQEIAGAEG
jgi:flavodoxin